MMYDHEDTLKDLNKKASLQDKMISVHEAMKTSFPFIVRVAMALYDPQTKVLKTFLHSSGKANPLDHYQSLLDDAPSLKEIVDKGKPRVINDLELLSEGKHFHTQRIGLFDYKASYTLPLYNEGVFMGFIFLNSNKKDTFTPDVLPQMDLYAHMIFLMIVNEILSVKTLSAAMKTTAQITNVRDPETGSHLDRMAQYSRIIALALAHKYDLSDSYIEHIFMFAPLHDIGKIGIPDRILLKAGSLDNQERAMMNTHTLKGAKIIDSLLKNFGLENVEYIDVLKNIAMSHHEAVNGSGYPEGIKGSAIPLEARIIAVADVFDALTNTRSYKEAWDNDKAIETLKQLIGETLDADCVNALVENMDQVIAIQERFNKADFE